MQIKVFNGQNERQAILSKELSDANNAYRNSGITLMSDLEYDKKLDELKAIEEENGFKYDISPTDKVGAAVISQLKQVTHESPALSLDKVKYKDREDLIEWLKNDQDSAIISWKCDGNTVVATYDDGKLVQAATRGDGEIGFDITHNARYFKGLPQKIACAGHLVVRGEAVMKTAEFERVNALSGGIYENSRNLASATIQMLDANESKEREITFIAFELVTPEPKKIMFGRGDGKVLDMRFQEDRFDFLSSLGFNVVEHRTCAKENILSEVEKFKDRLSNLDYPTDGLVISYNDMEYGMELGATEHHFRHSIALKWTDKTQPTTIRDIEWSVGKTGVITPVAIFDKVRLGLGSNVTRASLHNLSIMKRLGIKRNAKAEVYLANQIIPQCASCEDGDADFDIPSVCPVCGQPTRIEYNNGIEVLRCDNTECSARQIGNLMNTFSKDGLFIKGLGESQIADLMETGLVDATPLSFYSLQKRCYYDAEWKNIRLPKLLAKNGWGQKKYANLIKAIDASRDTTLQKFLYSLNISLLGNDLSKKLAKHWNYDISEFQAFVRQFVDLYPEDCTYDDKAYAEGVELYSWRELAKIDGIGPEKATNIINWIEILTMEGDKYAEFNALISELRFPEAAPMSSDNSLEGFTFVITGSVYQYKNRDEFKASVEERGGKVAGSVSTQTTALINNDANSTSGKNKKAKELGIEIISEDEFITRFGK